MKEAIVIKASDNALRMSDFMDSLPNGILQKRMTGVGGTHLTIISPHPYIICVPTVELIHNKCSQHSNILGVYAGFVYSELNYYLKQTTVPKIMVTYDSLPKLVEMLKLTCNPYVDYKLLIDEYHELLGAYSFRNSAVDGVLDESLKFEDKCFLSATPIEAQYCPQELEFLDTYTIDWGEVTNIIPIRKKTNKPFQAAVNIIKQYKASNNCLPVEVENIIKISKEAYFFIDSVKAIMDIIGNAGLTNEEVKIICADNKKNRIALDGFDISHASDPNKPFTFVTSKSFVGTDFYSETGIIYVISNVNRKNTLLDIGTEVFQIAGRIRNVENPFKNRIYHIYNTGASDLTREQFEKTVQDKVRQTNLQISLFNKGTYEERKASFKMGNNDGLDYSYYNETTNTLEFNYLQKQNEEFEFKIVHETYTNGLTVRNAYLKAGFDVLDSQQYEEITEKFINNITSIQFKEVLKEYTELIDCKAKPDCECADERIAYLENIKPEIVKMVNILGTTKLRSLKYNKKIINEVIENESPDNYKKIKNKIDSIFKANIPYPSSKIKEDLQRIYKNLGLIKKAKATDLGQFYKIDKKTRTIDGKITDSIMIVK